MGDYRKLIVWKRAHDLSVLASSLAVAIRSPHYSSLRHQIIRAAHSVAANIVEASAQESPRDFVRFVRYAINSANETEYHLFAAHELGLIRDEAFKTVSAKTVEVRRMLYGLMKAIRAAPPKTRN